MGGRPDSPKPPSPPYDLYGHFQDQMLARGYNWLDIDHILQNVVRTIEQNGGNTIFVGPDGSGVVVDPFTNELVTVLRPGMVPS